MKIRMLMVLVLMLTALAACGQADTTLKLNMAESDTYRLAMTNIQTTEMSIMGQSQTTVVENYTEISYNVLEITPDGNIKVEAVYETVVLTQTDSMSGQETTFDSRVDDPSLANPEVPTASLVGKSFTITYGPAGDVIAVDGFAELMEEVFGNFGEGAAESEAFRTLFSDSMEDSIKQASSLSGGVFYPEGPIEVGQTWQREQEISMQFMLISQDTTYTVENIADSQVTIALSSTGNVGEGNTDAFSALMGPDEDMDIGIDGNMNQTGTSVVDSTTGLMISSTTDMDAEIEMSIQGISVPMTIKSSIIMKRLP